MDHLSIPTRLARLFPVFAQSHGTINSNSNSNGTSNSITPVTTSPTPPWLIEKYSKHDGRERWISPDRNVPPALWQTGAEDGDGEEKLELELEQEWEEWQQKRMQNQKYAEIGRRRRGKRAVPGEQPTPTSSPQCQPFEQYDAEQKALYSPGYPGNYPNNTDCHVVLTGESPVS